MFCCCPPLRFCGVVQVTERSIIIIVCGSRSAIRGRQQRRLPRVTNGTCSLPRLRWNSEVADHKHSTAEGRAGELSFNHKRTWCRNQTDNAGQDAVLSGVSALVQDGRREAFKNQQTLQTRMVLRSRPIQSYITTPKHASFFPFPE